MSSISALITADCPKVDAQYRIAVMQAAHEGHPVQSRSTDWRWEDNASPTWNWGVYVYRIKPEPKLPTLRPWCTGEVPLGVVVRYKTSVCKNCTSPTYRYLVIASNHAGVHLGGHGVVSARELLEDFEHADRASNTWLPCGTYES